MADEEDIQGVIDAIHELEEDNTVPRNVKLKLSSIASTLKEEDSEQSMKINKALNFLEEITDDVNLEAYTRTQLWNIASMLESL